MDTANQRDMLLHHSRAILKRKCKAFKVSGEGSKTVMIDRIIRAMQNSNILNHNQQHVHANIQRTHVVPLDTRKLCLQRRLCYKPPNTKPLRYKTNASKNINSTVTHGTKVKKPKKNYLTLHLVGICPPRSYRYKDITSSTIDDIKIQSLSIKTNLVSYSTIRKLKTFIKTTYSIPLKYDLLILYSHMIISRNNDAKLKHYGVTDHSLLLIAISKGKTSRNYDIYSHEHIFRSLKYMKQSLEGSECDGVQQGFDIITQQTDVTVYKMPVCGHLMSRQSLYHYALSFFMNETNVYLQCCHTKDDDDDAKYDDDTSNWCCPHCTYVNIPSRSRYMDSSSSSDRKCAKCGRKKPQNISFAANQCNAVWPYVLIKQILLSCHDGYDAVDVKKLELLSARNKLMNTTDQKLNVQKCFHCKTVYFKSTKHGMSVTGVNPYRKFRSKCIFCCNFFCWNCGKQYRNNHECDGSSRVQIFNLLRTCLTKTIGNVHNVPSIRCCPNADCNQLITHLSACKHIKCRTCSTSFCFVCMKPMVNGRWQCGGSSDRCNIAPRQTLKSFHQKRAIAIDIKKTFQLLE